MNKIGLRGKGWLKGFHILFAGVWVGAAICMVLLKFFRVHISSGDGLWAVDMSVKLIDDFIIIPAAIGCLITGIIFSALTNWGFFKYDWIIAKYGITIAAALFGTFFLGPWVNGMEDISALEGIAALVNPRYLQYSLLSKYLGLLQTAALIFTVYISVFKPWGKRAGVKSESLAN